MADQSAKRINNFRSYYQVYDKVVLKMMPFYIDLHKEIVTLINKNQKEKFNVLELGFGTGALTHLLLNTFLNVEVRGIDSLSDNIEKAKQKLWGRKNFSYEHGDFKKIEFTGKYDYIISSLAVHHLSDIEKQKLFKKTFKALNRNGRFIIGDIVKSKDERLWHKYLVHEMGDEGEYRWQIHKHNKEDKLSTISSQLRWLKETGFKNVKYTKKWFNFYVFYGEKI